jgi:NifU-like protein involved in Fe-S cluster formation
MSMNLLLDTEDQPVIWRGPLVSRAIQQLWGDVMWGDLDLLLIDLPPGTSDATLTIMQSLPVDGLVMVTTPQSLASMVVRKAVHMAQIVGVNIIGIIENMAYYRCPDTGKKHFIFGASHSQQVAEAADAPILAGIPIYPEISDKCDAGNVEGINFDSLSSLLNAFARAGGLPPIAGGEPLVDRFPSQESAGEDLAAFSPLAQQVILNRENLGRLENPDLRGKVRGCCGDSMQIELILDGEFIQDARYMTDGCLATMACGGMLTRMIKGQTLQAVLNFTAEDLLDALGGLPKGHTHCASLAVKTLLETIRGSRLEDPLVVNPEDLPKTTF